MKITILAFLLACGTAAFGQSVGAVLSSQPQILELPDHPEHAKNHALAQEQNLRGEESPYTYAHGELPLSDFARASAAVPLGDVARNYREAHATARKARVVWEK